MRKNGLTTLAAAALSLVFVSCKDTKTLQQNEQLKSQVAELQQENGELRNQIESLTAERDELTQKNAALRERASRRTKRASKKASNRKTYPPATRWLKVQCPRDQDLHFDAAGGQHYTRIRFRSKTQFPFIGSNRFLALDWTRP